MKPTHTVSTDALATLGTIIDETAGRDAIHLAVEPVVAGETLFPGDHVGRSSDGRWRRHNRKVAVGIVDPFLEVGVEEGQRFWLVIYPRQITSLRHVWEHPAFDQAPEPETRNVEASKRWMAKWAMTHMGEDYYGGESADPQMAYDSAIEAGLSNHIGPYEDAREYIDDVWWDHWETITGKIGNRGGYFSCSC